MKKILTTLTALLMVVAVFAQSPAKYWQDLNANEISLAENTQLNIDADKIRFLSLNFDGMSEHLGLAPLEGIGSGAVEIDFPMPDGSVQKFAMQNSPIMEPGLAAKYSEIQTYAGWGIDDENAYLRVVTSPVGGFHALMISNSGAIRLSPAEGQLEVYRSYRMAHVHHDPNAPAFECGVGHDHDHPHLLDEAKHVHDNVMESAGRNPIGITDRYEYRFALATTGEFYNANGGNLTNVTTYVVEVMSDINTVFNRDAAIRLNLVDGTDQLFFDSPFMDPYTNGNTGVMIDENPPVLNDALGSSAYDVGHVFGTNAGGLANLASACSSSKGRGVSCQFGNAVGDDFFIIPAHEIGHMFNATHTFNLCDGDNETPSTGYEPGSGSTIMGYSGASNCNTQWPQLLGDPYFHHNSMLRIQDFSRDPATGGTCPEVITVGNNMPDVAIPFGEGLTIPISTPFELTADGSDIDGDDITYCWEQYDLGPASTLGMPVGNAPAFRSYPPTDDPTRVFPRIDRVVNNIDHPHEVLPTYTRDFTFRCTVRDNNEEAGAWGFEEVAFEATETAGPFLVTNPTLSSAEWEVGSFVPVTWDVANTTAMPVNCQTVNILLSLDGGFTYPVTLLTNTENDGEAMVTVPNNVTDMARVRVEANDNIFFDISNNNFSIIEATQAGFALTVSPQTGVACLPEAFEVDIVTESLAGFTEEITFSTSGLPNGAVANYSANPVAPGDNVTLTIDMTDVDVSGDFSVVISADAMGVPTADRTVDITVIDNDFSALQLLAPAGASGTTTLPTFSWTDLPNGLSYNIQIATDIDFNNIVEENTDLASTEYSPSIQLEENTVYYWRISVNNECGTGDWGLKSAFKTVAQSCNAFSAAPNENIPSGNGSVKTSVINVASGGSVSDVNVTNITGQYNTFGDLQFRLKGPSETVILIPGNNCFSSLGFNFGMDDEAPAGAFPCPPDNGGLFQPEESLSAFNGSNSQGEWTLELEVVSDLGDGGTLESWSLEICGASSALDPYLVTNETLGVPPLESRLVFIDNLEVRDDDNLAQELVFTIIDDVENGTLFLEGVELNAGDNFTMTDIYGSRVSYENTNDSAETDRFTFTVNDPDGGFFGTPTFNIVIDQDAPPSNANEVLASGDLIVYPNPTSDLLNVEFLNEVNGSVLVSVFNAQGQLMMERDFDSALSKLTLDVADLATGFHLIQVKTDNGIYAKKVMVE